MSENHLSNVLTEVQNAPNSQKIDRFISGLQKQMTQSGASPQQLGQDLQQLQAQFVKACQQQQGG